jgi:hypothetical protein
MNTIFECLTRDRSGDEKQYFERFLGRKKRKPKKGKKKGWNFEIKNKKEKERKYKRVPKQYKVYIKSHWWEERKNKYWKTHTKQCYRCFTFEYVQLHHIKYSWQSFGNEPDDTLIPMCRDCHDTFHSIYGVKGNMMKEMLLFEEEHPF